MLPFFLFVSVVTNAVCTLSSIVEDMVDSVCQRDDRALLGTCFFVVDGFTHPAILLVFYF